MKRKFIFTVLILCIVIPLFPMAAKAEYKRTYGGWYYLRCMYNYLNIDAQGKAELRNLGDENAVFYLEFTGSGYEGVGKVTLRLKDGRYLGLDKDDERKDGTRVKAVDKPYDWLTYQNYDDPQLYSLRPPEAYCLVVNASGSNNNDGTPIILWTHMRGGGLVDNSNQNCKFRFIPAEAENDTTGTSDPTGESWVVYEENGKYGYKDRYGNVMIKAQFDQASQFIQGIASVYSKEKDYEAVIDTTGKPITPYKYMFYEWKISEGMILAGKRSNDAAKYKWGYINTKGKEVIPLKFDWAYSFSEGLAAVLKYEGWKGGSEVYSIGWIDTTGKLVIPYKSYFPWQISEEKHDFKEGLVTYYVNPSKDPDVAPGAGIMNKTGKVIIPAKEDEYFPSGIYVCDRKDGVIAYGPYKRVNEKGVPDKNGKYQWNFVSLYDYSGKLIKKLDGYVEAYPLGSGYTAALRQTFDDVVNKHDYSGYWSIFDRNGNMVVEKAEVNNFNIPNLPMGEDNGYVYFGDNTRYKIPTTESKATKNTPGKVNEQPESHDADTASDTETGSDVLTDGVYYIKASKDPRFVVDLTGSSKEDGAKLIIFTNHGTENQKFRITKVGDSKYTIQCVHSGKYWKSSGKKAAVLTQSGTSTDDSAIFTIKKQENGTWRIADSKGLYVAVSGAKMANETHVILWTEASDGSQTFTFEKIQ